MTQFFVLRQPMRIKQIKPMGTTGTYLTLSELPNFSEGDPLPAAISR
jgi:hypothetical protein